MKASVLLDYITQFFSFGEGGSLYVGYTYCRAVSVQLDVKTDIVFSV